MKRLRKKLDSAYTRISTSLSLRQKILVAGFALMLVVVIYLYAPGDYLTIAHFQAHQQSLVGLYQQYPVIFSLAYVCLFIVLTSLCMPVMFILSLAAGAIFGFIVGLFIVSLSTSTGSLVAFLLSRYLFRDYVQNRFAEHLRPVNNGIAKDGALYLFIMRIVPVFPYFIVNLTMAMTPIRAFPFYAVTLTGMLPVIAILVNAGLQLSRISTPADIFSLKIIFSLLLVALFPLVLKKTIARLKTSSPAEQDETV